MKGTDIRQKYVEFFEGKNHKVLPSASLIPDDPTILITIAGMVPFKPIFMGKEKPTYPRVTSCQKCVRTNDIDNVGRTARHHTFFEMLGNFSFGDYFKEDAIKWAWEFVTKELKLDKDRLWISVYKEDEESLRIWHEKAGVPKERIVKMGEEDNFWSAGPTGSCGPCSEIYYDLGEEIGCGSPDCAVGCECDRYLEIWNLVFTEYDRDENGKLHPLPQKNIDTGMGLERIASVMQGMTSNFDADLIRPLIDKMAAIAGVSYKENEKTDLSLKVIADHIRAINHLISDGVLPSNEGRGYILRRILRRAVRHGKLLGVKESFLDKMAALAIEMGQDVYPALREKQAYIIRIIRTEEARFQETLDQGLEILKEMVEKIKEAGTNQLTGEDAFKLYDTYGFPYELTEEILEENELCIDRQGFEQALEAQRERARSARTDEQGGLSAQAYDELKKISPTQFVGYDTLKDEVRVEAIIANDQLINEASAGEKVGIILNKTPFYAESGGQVGDRGVIESNSTQVVVEDTKKFAGDKFIHHSEIKSGKLSVGDVLCGAVDEERRLNTSRNHTVTHLLQQALRDVVGDHVNQAGSMVGPERLRFDFTHFEALTPQEIEKVENRVNEKIFANLAIDISEGSIEEAKAKGATALFGEKYGEIVRMVNIDGYSLELCGGCHLQVSSEGGLFKIIAEEGIGSGLRRIEGVTGPKALAFYHHEEKLLQEAAALLKTRTEELPARIEQMMQGVKEKEREIEQLKAKLIQGETSGVMSDAVDVEGIQVVAHLAEGLDMEGLRQMGDNLRDQIGSGVIVLGAVQKGKVNLMVVVTKDMIPKGIHAGKLIKELAAVVGGGGGGRPDMAQAGGKLPEKLPEALQKVPELVKKQLL